MGLKKTYKRYELLSSFGVIASTRSNIAFIPPTTDSSTNKKQLHVVVGSLEDTVIWDTRKGDKVKVFKGDKHEVTALSKVSQNQIVASGYHDGSIKIWNVKDGTERVTLSGHKSAVSCLSFDDSGARLVSGSNDTDVIVWDVLNESGLYRLKGHKGLITRCQFLKKRNVLVTSSKDTFIKFWDLDTQHCFSTIVRHRGEVWTFGIVQDETRLITGSSDSELRVWNLAYDKDGINSEVSSERKRKHSDAKEEDEEQMNVDENVPLTHEYLGSIIRQSKERVACMTIDQSERSFACHGPDNLLEIFKLCTEEETKTLLKKKRKRLKKKLRDKPEADQMQEITDAVKQTVEDEIQALQAFKLKGKLRSCDVILESPELLKVAVLQSNNAISTYKITLSGPNVACEPVAAITSMGHRSDVRTLSFSSDDTCILSGASEGFKIWNRSSGRCIRTLASDYAITSFFAPGDRHAIIGTKTGKLQLYDISSGVHLETIDAHSGPVWGLCLSPDKRGFISGSEDHDVKFWEFELIDDLEFSQTSKRLSMVHLRTLKMAEDVLCVKYSPDQRFLAVALLDSTVKVFFSDTLKFFLSLYGHKLPVLCMDMSSDGSLLATGSSDKNIKLWGLDFGDCHKSIFAHDDSIMDVKIGGLVPKRSMSIHEFVAYCHHFVPRTHYFFSISKDKTLKYWDGDRFENILTLKGHQSEVLSLAVSKHGDFVVTGSHDKSIRLWERTEELLVIEEEREQEREAAFEEGLAEEGETVIPGEVEGEATLAGKKTLDTMKGAERIMEAVELFKAEQAKLYEYQEACRVAEKQPPRPAEHPILAAYGGISPSRYVLEEIKRIRSSELEESLLVLPFHYVIDLLKLLSEWIQRSWQIELSSRCLFFLLRVHHNQIVSNHVLLGVVDSLREVTKSQLREYKDQVGFNVAALQFMQRELEGRNITIFSDATEKFKQKRKRRKAMVPLL